MDIKTLEALGISAEALGERIVAYVTQAQKRKFIRKGGSQWLRKIIHEAR